MESPPYTRMSHTFDQADASAPMLSAVEQPAGASRGTGAAASMGEVALSPLTPQPSTTHVNFHGSPVDDGLESEGDGDDEAARLSPPAAGESSSKEPSVGHFPASAATVSAASNPAAAAAAVSSPSSSASSPGFPSSAPPTLIAFVNFHSGGAQGERMAAELTRTLGRERVFDLKGSKGPRDGLRLFKGTPNLRVIAGGGDGTQNWVLSELRNEGMTDVPMGCIPLGTGNDASRCFGWGFKNPSVETMNANVARMRNATPDTFLRYDRWHAFAQYDTPPSREWVASLPASVRAIHRPEDLPQFYRAPRGLVSLPPVPSAKLLKKMRHQESPPQPHAAADIDLDAAREGYNVEAIPLSARGDPAVVPHPLPPPIRQANEEEAGLGSCYGQEWNNYLSWGVDAETQHDFHRAREGCRSCFCHRWCNMAWMGIFGALNMCACSDRTLDVSVEVRDEEGRWVRLPLPPLSSLVLLNTPTYGGGRFPWGRRATSRPPRQKEWECASQRQCVDDGLFELIGFTSPWHLAGVMGQFTRGLRIAQVNEARITLRAPTLAQADGEPWREMPGTIHIRPLRPQLMMTRPSHVVKTH